MFSNKHEHEIRNLTNAERKKNPGIIMCYNCFALPCLLKYLIFPSSPSSEFQEGNTFKFYFHTVSSR